MVYYVSRATTCKWSGWRIRRILLFGLAASRRIGQTANKEPLLLLPETTKINEARCGGDEKPSVIFTFKLQSRVIRKNELERWTKYAIGYRHPYL